MVHSSIVLFISCLTALAFVQTNAFMGFMKKKSHTFHTQLFEMQTEEENENITEHFITQRLDNFDTQNKQTFEMRYLQSDVHFKSGGPVFIMVGGEWEITPKHNSPNQHLYDLAEEFNGLLIYTEHRYYGKSRPTNTTSVENLKYLSVDQSLADLAHFITELTLDKELNASGGVILVGASYSGTMVAWFRQKYPHLVRGAWASSAPMRAKLDFYEYTEAVAEAILHIGGDKCYRTVEQIFHTVTDMSKNINNGINILKELFLICDGFDENDEKDIMNLKTTIKDFFSRMVQVKTIGIKPICDKLIANPATSTFQNYYVSGEQMVNFAQEFLKHTLEENETCVSMSYKDGIEYLKSEDWSVEARLWFYQTCSEFGWYPTTNSRKQPFGSGTPVEIYTTMCNEVYGDSFSSATVSSVIDHKNVLYGALSPAVTNVVFTYGTIDPWRQMGITKDLNEHSFTLFYPDLTHTEDMASISYEKDSKTVIENKVTIINLVRRWLKL